MIHLRIYITIAHYGQINANCYEDYSSVQRNSLLYYCDSFIFNYSVDCLPVLPVTKCVSCIFIGWLGFLPLTSHSWTMTLIFNKSMKSCQDESSQGKREGEGF